MASAFFSSKARTAATTWGGGTGTDCAGGLAGVTDLPLALEAAGLAVARLAVLTTGFLTVLRTGFLDAGFFLAGDMVSRGKDRALR